MLQSSAIGQSNSSCVVASGFATYDQSYHDKLSAYFARLRDMSDRLKRLNASGLAVQASQQLFIHAKWLTRYTAYWSRLDDLLDRLEDSFLDYDQSYVASQSPVDGSWGWHYREFHHKFDATIGRLHELASQQVAPEYALDFLEPVATRDKMIETLERLRTSDIPATGRNQRDEYGAVLTCLGQICFKPKLRDYVQRHVKGIDLDQAYVAAFEDFLDQSQNPDTGYWGPWYRANGQVHRYDDLSYTFHITSYRKGQVKRWPQIIETTFANKVRAYPAGWLHNGHFNNHNNYDVAKIFRFGWPHMTMAEKTQARAEIRRMLDWCLTHSMDNNGGFVMDASYYNSVEACYYFGISFLEEIGVFDPDRCFWSEDEFEDRDVLADKLQQALGQLNQNHEQITAARWKLDRGEPRRRARRRTAPLKERKDRSGGGVCYRLSPGALSQLSGNIQGA